MMKSASISTPLEAEPREVKRIRASQALTLALLLAACAAYCLPWAIGRTSGTSLTAYDLAEWSSLVPGVRYGEQPMLIPGLLRVQLVFMASLLMLAPRRRGSAVWWFCGAAALTLAVAQLPPFEYFINEGWRADVNYGQQFTLALIGMIDAVVCAFVPRGWPRRIAAVLFAAAAIFTALTGVTRALGLMGAFGVSAALGAGVFVYGMMLVTVVLSIFSQQKEGV